MKRIVILGDGELAREVYWHVVGTHPSSQPVFADDYSDRTEIRMGQFVVPVIKDWCFDALCDPAPTGSDNEIGFVVGVGKAQFKKDLVEKALAAGLRPAPTIIHPRALVQGCDCVIGVGGVITPGSILTVNVKIGDYVILNLNTTVGHDAIIGDYVTCNPGCHVSGYVTVGEGASLGTGTAVRQGITIAAGVVTGAQACVVKNIDEPGITVAGVPAKKLQ